MGQNDLSKMTEHNASTEIMPVLFLGHGSPMNAIEDNEYSRTWEEIGKTLSRPKIIICISCLLYTSDAADE